MSTFISQHQVYPRDKNKQKKITTNTEILFLESNYPVAASVAESVVKAGEESNKMTS